MSCATWELVSNSDAVHWLSAIANRLSSLQNIAAGERGKTLQRLRRHRTEVSSRLCFWDMLNPGKLLKIYQFSSIPACATWLSRSVHEIGHSQNEELPSNIPKMIRWLRKADAIAAYCCVYKGITRHTNRPQRQPLLFPNPSTCTLNTLNGWCSWITTQQSPSRFQSTWPRAQQRHLYIQWTRRRLSTIKP